MKRLTAFLFALCVVAGTTFGQTAVQADKAQQAVEVVKEVSTEVEAPESKDASLQQAVEERSKNAASVKSSYGAAKPSGCCASKAKAKSAAYAGKGYNCSSAEKKAACTAAEKKACSKTASREEPN